MKSSEGHMVYFLFSMETSSLALIKTLHEPVITQYCFKSCYWEVMKELIRFSSLKTVFRVWDKQWIQCWSHGEKKKLWRNGSFGALGSTQTLDPINSTDKLILRSGK